MRSNFPRLIDWNYSNISKTDSDQQVLSKYEFRLTLQ